LGISTEHAKAIDKWLITEGRSFSGLDVAIAISAVSSSLPFVSTRFELGQVQWETTTIYRILKQSHSIAKSLDNLFLFYERLDARSNLSHRLQPNFCGSSNRFAFSSMAISLAAATFSFFTAASPATTGRYYPRGAADIAGKFFIDSGFNMATPQSR